MPPPAVASDAKRPLVLAAVLLGMIFILIYILITFPRPLIAAPRGPQSPIMAGGGSDADPSSARGLLGDDDPFRFADQPFHRHHIPNIVQPSLYQIQLKVYLPWRPGVTFGALDFTMDGKTQMEFTVLRATRRIQLNIKQLNITSVRVYRALEEIHVDEISEDYPQLLDIFTTMDLQPGHHYRLVIKFKTNINNPRFAGVFVAPYPTKRNKFANPREARPVCFHAIDSPEAKARFDATVIHPEGTYALFNMKETNVTTSKLPLSAFSPHLLCGYEVYIIANHTMREESVRIYAEEGKLNDTSMALDLVPRLLAFFEDYFQLPYPLMKL
ncbi:peptidase family M1, partial [Ostertagia ostertagi]